MCFPRRAGTQRSTLPEPAPEKYFAAFPRGAESTSRSARAGLTTLFPPGRDGRLRRATHLRFSGDWGSAYQRLDRFDPPSVAPVAGPDELVDWLQARDEISEPEEARRAAYAFARQVGVWETAPLHYLDEPD